MHLPAGNFLSVLQSKAQFYKMSNLQEVLDTQRQIEDTFLSKMAGFEKQLKATAPDSKPNLERLCKEFEEFKNSVWSILTLLRSLVTSLTYKVDDLDNQSRRNALLFSGVQECDGEDCMAAILNIIHSKMGLVDFQKSSFLLCHRLGLKNVKRNRPILVRFSDIASRNLLWREKKRLKSGSAVLSEFLTKTRQDVFITARKHFGITRCWTQDGQVYVKLPDNNRRRILTAQELDALISKFPMTGIVKKGSGVSPREPAVSRPAEIISTASAAVPEPPVTRRNHAAKAKLSK